MKIDMTFRPCGNSHADNVQEVVGQLWASPTTVRILKVGSLRVNRDVVNPFTPNSPLEQFPNDCRK